jgi:acyl-coenzyme A thioesterase PaaI-like protein
VSDVRTPDSRFGDPDAGRSVARYLGLTLEEIGEVREGAATVRGHAPAPEYLRAPDGTIAMGALLGLADSVAGLCGGLAALPGWVVSTNLMLRAVHLDVVGPLALRADVLRAGRNAVVTSVSIRDSGAEDRLVADGALTSAILVPDGGPPVYDRPLRLDAPTLDPSVTPKLADFLGTRAVADGTLAVDVTEQLRNPWGILHGGATAALVDLAARHATGGRATTDAVLHFLAPGRVGPVTASVTTVGTRADGTLVRAEVRDQGADDRLMAVAVATVAP